MPGESVVLAGVSTRAFAESAARAGWGCASVDAFGDLDQKSTVQNLGVRRDVGRDYSALLAADLTHRFAARSAAYVGNLENHPRAVRRLAAGRELLGNGPSVLARCRDLAALAEAVEGVARVPRTLRGPGVGRADPDRRWLRKPARGGGGSGVREWEPGTPIGRGEVVQERIDGVLGSVAFLADGRHATVLGISRLLSGEPAFGAPGYRYAGNLYPLDRPGGRPGGEEARSPLAARARDLAEALTAWFGLRGLNGADFVWSGGELFLLELNPRYPASAELVERATGLSAFGAHVAACRGELVEVPAPGAGTWGKAVVYASRDVVVPATQSWLERGDRSDIPFPGERIRETSPVCTVFARGADERECRAGLESAAVAVQGELEAVREPVRHG